MPRCRDCEKFVSLEQGEPEAEVDVENVDGNGSVTGSVRIVLTCGECSQEMKDAQLDVALVIELRHAEGCPGEQELELEFSPEAVDKFEPPKAKRQKHFYGAEATATVTCPCGASGAADWSDYVQSSAMDELS